MRRNFKSLLILLVLLFATSSFSQNYLQKTLTGKYSQEELVTMSPTLPFQQAVELLSKISFKASGRKIVSTAEYNQPIGVEITNMFYLKAMDIIVKYAGLVYEQKDDMIIIKKDNTPEVKKDENTYASVDAREVKITTVFFESDVTKSRQLGINWQFLLSKNGLDVGGQLGSVDQTSSSNSGSNTATTGGQLNLKSSFETGGFFGEATAIFKFLESENAGEIIASPIATVRDGREARIQDGADFSIKQQDFAGNTIEKFYPTGTILQVTPHVYNEKGINYILLDLNAERSTFTQTTEQSVIKKTSAKTQVVLLDGEETIIGGLFINEENVERTGVPFLKDLPWWFFGLRYIFGSDQTTLSKKELIILIKAELVPTLKERISTAQSTNPIKDEILKQRDRIKYYKFNNESTQKDN